MRRGFLDEAARSAPAAIDGAGLVILAGPPLAVIGSIEALGGPLREALHSDATVTDVASTKAQVVDAADRHGLPFVGGHPMAGREASGASASIADLFVDRPWAIVPGAGARPVDLERVESLATATGARPMRLTAAAHDEAVAAISHLPLVLAAALVETVAASPEGSASWPLARELAAGGWRDMTRIARGDAEMGAGILATNADLVAARLEVLRDVIQTWLDELAPDGADPGVLRAHLDRAREVLEREPERGAAGT